MSLVTKGIGLVKKLKHRYDAKIKARAPVFLSPVRRIERVKTKERVVAMTFDDGPSDLLPNPAGHHTEALTTVLRKTLNAFGAKGTFDVIGSTASSYPDRAGKEGTASWSGERFDHYPDIFQDDRGGVVACSEIVRELIADGHEIANHTYAHILFGRKPLIYGKRNYLGKLDAVLADLKKLHEHMQEHYGYEIALSRPPHYVDAVQSGITSYDAYALMGYQYMAASFDGAGWLPLADYESEVEAMWKPIAAALKQDPDYFCGQIIFQKDGFNMARRTPVADGLPIQLKLLTDAGYKVVTVSELLRRSPFADAGEGDRCFNAAKELVARGFCVAYNDNTVRADRLMTQGELCMTCFGKRTVSDRVNRILYGEDGGKRGGKFGKKRNPLHPYSAAIDFALRNGFFEGNFRADAPITAQELRFFVERYRRMEESGKADFVRNAEGLPSDAAYFPPEGRSLPPDAECFPPDERSLTPDAEILLSERDSSRGVDRETALRYLFEMLHEK